MAWIEVRHQGQHLNVPPAPPENARSWTVLGWYRQWLPGVFGTSERCGLCDLPVRWSDIFDFPPMCDECFLAPTRDHGVPVAFSAGGRESERWDELVGLDTEDGDPSERRPTHLRPLPKLTAAEQDMRRQMKGIYTGRLVRLHLRLARQRT